VLSSRSSSALGPKHLQVLGTAFFIDGKGVLLTARHLFDEYDARGLYIAQHLPHEGTTLIRNIDHLAFRADRCDVALAVVRNLEKVGTGETFKGPNLVLTSVGRTAGEHICTFAYTRAEYVVEGDFESVTFSSDYYFGQLVEHYERRDSMLPTSCWRTSMHILPGASGGPVFNSSGHVFALNSSSYNDKTDLSFVSDIHPALNLPVSNGRITSPPMQENISLQDLIDRGFIKVEST
jgi:hypothetical protein